MSPGLLARTRPISYDREVRLLPLLLTVLAACVPTTLAAPPAPAASTPAAEAPTPPAAAPTRSRATAAPPPAPAAPTRSRATAAPPPAPTTPTPSRATAAPPAAAATALPPVRTFQFTATTRKQLPGDGTAADGTCTEQVGADDQLGDLAVLAAFYQNGCYTDGQYNARGYVVEQGTVTASDGATFAAYRLHPPATAAAVFLGSHHVAHLRLATAEDHTLYALEADSPVVHARLAAAQITAGGWTRLPLDLTTLGRPITVFVAPSRQPVTALSPLGATAQGAQLGDTPLGSLALYRHPVAGTPYDVRTDTTTGPDARRDRRRLFPVELGGGALGVVWQDATDARVRVTEIAGDQRTTRERVLANPRKDILAAAASDGASAVYMFFVQPADGALTTRATRLVRLDLSTGEATERAADAGPDGLNITQFDDVASMAVDRRRVLLLIGRTMHRSADGLNHQGGIAVEFDPQTLAVTRNHGQTSGHSFDNVLTTGAPGELLGLDLGDNYPRGIHLHRFTTTLEGKPARRSALAYSFKTQHGTTAVAPDGRTHAAYPEISTGDTHYFKWSNDNGTYTELGGVVATPTGYTIVFAGEAVNGRALDNGRAGTADPRNLAVVHLRRDFDTLPPFKGVIPDAAMLTHGRAEAGGFYDFGGTWSPQRNTGVVWLTGYRTPDANATHIRVARLADGNALVLWEQWTRRAYVTTFGMKIDPLGQVLTPAVDLGARVRLGQRDDVLVRGNDVYVVTGRAADHALDVVVLHAR